MPNVILRLSGTFGSGKTTAVRKFIEDYPSETLMGGKKIMGYRIDLTSLDVEKPLFIVGKYDNVCGGTDSINTQLEVAERIIKAHALGHVLYEGALVSASGLGGKVTQIDTPQDKCIDRVINRRLTAGNTKEFDPKNLVAKFGGVTACRQHVTEAGFRVVDVDHMNTHPPLVKIIKDFEIS